MSGLSHEEVQRHVKIYVRVFLALAALTVLTVLVSYFHLPLLLAILVALFIATLKGSLVAGFFMHLVSEKPVVLYLLILAFVLFLALLFLPTLSHS